MIPLVTIAEDNPQPSYSKNQKPHFRVPTEDDKRTFHVLVSRLTGLDLHDPAISFGAIHDVDRQVISRLRQFIYSRFYSLVNLDRDINIDVEGEMSMDVLRNGYILSIGLRGDIACRSLRADMIIDFLLDDSFAKRFVISLLSHAATLRWMR